jgi:hypothetical protein
MEDIVSFRGHNPNYKRVGETSLETYMRGYETIDVAIAPLVENNFNKHKSSLKFYEAASKKCAFIASDMSPYADDVPRDIAFLCRRNKDWVDAIKKCKDLALVKELGEKSYEWVKGHRNMRKINALRLEVFAHIMQKG